MPVAEKINSEIIQPKKKEIIQTNKMGLLVENPVTNLLDILGVMMPG